MKKTLVACLLILFAAFAARAEDLEKPLLLVASPALQGPYSRTALLVFPMRGQHAGFILNRSTDVKLASVFPEHAPSAKVADPIFFGGPEMMDSLFALVRNNPGEGAVQVLERPLRHRGGRDRGPHHRDDAERRALLRRLRRLAPGRARQGDRGGLLVRPGLRRRRRRSATTPARCGRIWWSASATAIRSRRISSAHSRALV